MAVHKAIIVAVPVILVILLMPARLGRALVALLLAVAAFGAHVRAHNATPVLPWTGLGIVNYLHFPAPDTPKITQNREISR